MRAKEIQVRAGVDTDGMVTRALDGLIHASGEVQRQSHREKRAGRRGRLIGP